jgi:hypothetical protein
MLLSRRCGNSVTLCLRRLDFPPCSKTKCPALHIQVARYNDPYGEIWDAHGRWPRRPERGLCGQRFPGEFHAIATGLLGGVEERIRPRQQSVDR